MIHWQKDNHLTKNTPSHLINLIIMPTITIPQCQMETHTGNKKMHPGNVIKPAQHHTTAEVQEEHRAKAQAQAAHAEAKQQSINHTAEFGHADMANEDTVDATPCPPFTPKQWPPVHNRKKSTLVPIEETSDVGMLDDDLFDFGSKKSVTAGNSGVEHYKPPPPAKK